MCDAVADDDGGCSPKVRQRRRAPDLEHCLKCRIAKPTIIVRNSRYCRSCFGKVFYTKMRGVVNATEAPTPADQRPNVLIAVSGGASSRALLHLMSFYHLNRPKGSQPKFGHVAVLHIDESSLFQNAEEAKAQRELSKYEFKVINRRLEDAFGPSQRRIFLELADQTLKPGEIRDSFSGVVKRVAASDTTSPKELLTRFFGSISTNTAKEDALEAIKLWLIVDTARTMGYQIVAVGDSATRLAVKTIAFTSGGRGLSLPYDIGAETRWFKDVYIIRPMKDMLAKEIAYFNHCLELETAHTPTFTTKAPTKASIGRATEAFIVGLDRDYLSTVSTVGRTAAKLQPTQETRGAPSCIMCSMPVGANSSIWRGRVTVSNVTGGVMKLTPSTTSSAQMPLSPADSGGPDLTLTDWLCYSCQNTMRDVRTNTILPRFTIEALKYNASTASQGQEEYGSNLKVPVADTEPRQRLRKLVEEFLLSDTDDDDDDDKDNNHSNNNEEGGTC